LLKISSLIGRDGEKRRFPWAQQSVKQQFIPLYPFIVPRDRLFGGERLLRLKRNVLSLFLKQDVLLLFRSLSELWQSINPALRKRKRGGEKGEKERKRKKRVGGCRKRKNRE